MTADTFARATATTAHQRATAALAIAANLERRLNLNTGTRRPEMIGLCCLCGDPTPRNRRYCRAHNWAAKE
jgi:hypothetical protein